MEWKLEERFVVDVEKLKGKGKIIVRKALIKGVDSKTISNAIEAISKSIAEDAKELYGKRAGFKAEVLKEEKNGKKIVKTVIKYWPYHYDFEWIINEKKENIDLELLAFSPRNIWRSMFGWYDGLYGLVELQWAGITEFCLGYVQGYAKAKGGK